MDAPPLRFFAVRPSELAYRGAGAVINIFEAGSSYWLFDGTQIRRRLLSPLKDLSSQTMTATPLRNAPSDEPWGEVRIAREDIGLDEMFWELTEHGIYIPVPRGLITDRLAAEMSALGTDALVHFDPPPLGSLPQIGRL